MAIYAMTKPDRRWSSYFPVMARYGVAVASVTAALISSRWLDTYLVAAPVSLIADPTLARRDGLGFANMRARADHLGAEFEVQTATARGTRVVVRLPLHR
jgi:hypothetical protein